MDFSRKSLGSPARADASSSDSSLWNTPPGGRFGEDEVTYRKACEFLDQPGWLIEDWGCGGQYFRRFIRHSIYRGVDGSGTPDIKVDLRFYRSEVDAILLRHVLEHNHDWRLVLQNAIESFRHRMVIVIFTEFGKKTRQIATNRNGTPDLSFRKENLTQFFPQYREEEFSTLTQYMQETIFYLWK